MLRSFRQVSAAEMQQGVAMLNVGMRTSLIFNTQHVATGCSLAQHVTPNNVVIFRFQMLRSFNRSLQMLGQQRWDILC